MMRVRYKLWLEHKGEPLLGEGRYSILKLLEETNSVQRTAAVLSIAPKTIYNYISRMESRLGKDILIAKKGGRLGGAKVFLTPAGKRLIAEYEEAKKRFR
ncbi:MAG: LysR family transcriptional regulator [Nanoarchaeota archaeon]|nr:LysR family transcriptional regulator [Nanoarchaeota archaeon]